MSLSDAELERYSRQLVMSDWSAEAQLALKHSSCVIVGAGALGCPVATYLVAAGVGELAIVDGDRVELSNLHRQPLHHTSDIGQSKAESAAAKLVRINPEVRVDPCPAKLDAHNAPAILAGADAVVDCSDSFAVRYLVNDVCCDQGICLVEGSVVGFRGSVLSVRPGESACYRCVFSVQAEGTGACQEEGVLGAVASLVGSIQALEAIKLVTGVGPALLNRLLELDARDMTQTLVTTRRRPQCTACGEISRARQFG